MKKLYLQLGLTIALGISLGATAQIDPGTANLTHQWTFDDGTANDKVGTCHGTLEGAATISGKALNTLAGGYLTLPAADIAVNSYPALTTEIWFTSGAGLNGGNTMLSYFGETVGNYGANYIFTTPSNGGKCRLAISCGNTSSPWSVENGVNSPSGKIDDGNLHQLISVIDPSGLYYYVDGLLVGSTAFTNTNALSAVSNSLAYLCKAGYKSDPTWKGLVNKFSMYNKALTSDEVLYLFMKGAEEQPVISATAASIALDENYPSVSFSVSSSNLTSDVNIICPEGIIASPTTVTANTNNVLVSVFYTGGAVNGNIELKSGSTSITIPVKSASDAACYVPLYSNIPNMVLDPGCNDLAMFAGWGAKETVNIINNPTAVYCGASSLKVGNGTVNSGSIDFTLTGLLSPNTSYRVKAMVKTIDGSCQIGIWGYESGKGDLNNKIDTKGEWMPLDFVFTTGATLGDTQGMFFNNYNCTGLTGYIDNWEMYVYDEPLVTVNKTDLAFDPEFKSATIISGGTKLTSNIAIAVPAGISVDPQAITFDPVTNNANDTVTVTYDGTTAVNGDITFSSGSASKTVKVKSTSVSNTSCFSPLFTNKTNLIPDPYLNDASKFGGWGGKEFISIVTEADSVYCGSHSARVVGGGSLDVSLYGIIKKNTSYKARVMVRSIGEFQIGVGGIDVNGANSDVNKSFDTNGNWQAVEFDFTTGDSLRVNNIPLFINNWQKSGTRCTIDNYELYEVEPSAVKNNTIQATRVFVSNNQISTLFESVSNEDVTIEVFDLQGKLVASKIVKPFIGSNKETINTEISAGAYIVKLSQAGKSSYAKLIK